MTTQEVIATLEQVKTFCSSSQLDPVDYAVHVFKRFERAGITDPVHADFSKLSGSEGSAEGK